MAKGVMVAGYGEVFLAEARRCVERSREAASRGDAAEHGGAAGSAILAACTAIEATHSERLPFLLHKGHLGEGVVEAIERRDSLFQRVNGLVKALKGPPLDAEPWYCAFVALTKLRNAIVHRSAEFLDTTAWPPRLQGHERHFPHRTEPGLDWTSRVLTADTAAWAVETARTVIETVDETVPKSNEGINVAIGPVEA